MIGYLGGTALDERTVVCGGVGYDVHTVQPLQAGQSATLWIRTVVRDTDISLYGFEAPAERDLFDALTKVNGVGPKAALGILTLGAGTVAQALRDGDHKTLAQAPGIGPKKAQQITASVTVPGSAAALADTPAGGAAGVVGALLALGYRPGAARDAVDDAISAGADATDEGQLLRRALARLRAA